MSKSIRERREEIDQKYEYAKKGLSDIRFQAITRLQHEYTHPHPTYHRDPHRKSDSFYHCEDCGKYYK